MFKKNIPNTAALVAAARRRTMVARATDVVYAQYKVEAWITHLNAPGL